MGRGRRRCGRPHPGEDWRRRERPIKGLRGSARAAALLALWGCLTAGCSKETSGCSKETSEYVTYPAAVAPAATAPPSLEVVVPAVRLEEGHKPHELTEFRFVTRHAVIRVSGAIEAGNDRSIRAVGCAFTQTAPGGGFRRFSPRYCELEYAPEGQVVTYSIERPVTVHPGRYEFVVYGVGKGEERVLARSMVEVR